MAHRPRVPFKLLPTSYQLADGKFSNGYLSSNDSLTVLLGLVINLAEKGKTSMILSFYKDQTGAASTRHQELIST